MAISQEQFDAKSAEVETLKAQLAAAEATVATKDTEKVDAKTTAKIEERERIAAIIESAPDKPLAAKSLAMNTSLSVDEAAKTLAAMPVEVQATNDPLHAVMSGTNPIVGNDAGEPSEDSLAASSWDDIIKGVAV